MKPGTTSYPSKRWAREKELLAALIPIYEKLDIGILNSISGCNVA